jgi:DNA (cytosine-5)-methyltransferase 1
VALHSTAKSKSDRLAGIALCAGVGGLELGLHIAEPGYRTVCYVEREVAAAATLVARMADTALDEAPLWDDLKTFDGRPWRGKVDIVTAGYPCQPFSFAGRKRGKKDPRHLWPEISRIIKEVDPEWVYCENVEGHLTLGLSEVISGLRGMGFTPKAGLFSAAETGASHLRRRLFILAHTNRCPPRQPHRTSVQQKGHAVSGGNRHQKRPGVPLEGRDCVVANGDNCSHDRRDNDDPRNLHLFAPSPFELDRWDTILAGRMDLQPVIFGLDDGLAFAVERSNAVGNGVVPLVAALAWRTLRAAHSE